MRASHGENGATFVEALIATPLFIILVFAAMQMMMLSWRALTLQFVTTAAIREVILGKCSSSSVCNDNATRVNYLRTFARNRATQLGVTLTQDNSEICVRRTIDGTGICDQPGQPTDLVVVTIKHQSPVLFTNISFGSSFSTGIKGPFSLKSDAIGRVERFQ